MADMFPICSPQPNWMPKNPKLMFQICQKLRRGLFIDSFGEFERRALLLVVADLELIEVDVVLFAVAVEDGEAFDVAAAAELSARQLRELLVAHRLNLQIVAVAARDGHS